MKRMAAASRLLPAPVLAKIAEKVFGPLLCARIAGMIEPGKATDVAVRLPVGFLTDLAVELDPRRSHRVIGNIPSDTVVPIAAELTQRQGRHRHRPAPGAAAATRFGRLCDGR